jgi:hypothetical protein
MSVAIITYHGYERVKERTHLKGKKAEQTIDRIWRKGKTYEEISTKQLYNHVRDIATATQNLDKIVKMFGNSVYIFASQGVLITVLDIPSRLLGR